MTTLNTTRQAVSLDMRSVFERVALLFRSAKRRVIQRLTDFDDYLLADIGIIRSEIHEVIVCGHRPWALNLSV
jgi:uncharacterized protein YjiS (DUF1127 family)